jgi:hypothetical protein
VQQGFYMRKVCAIAKETSRGLGDNMTWRTGCNATVLMRSLPHELRTVQRRSSGQYSHELRTACAHAVTFGWCMYLEHLRFSPAPSLNILSVSGLQRLLVIERHDHECAKWCAFDGDLTTCMQVLLFEYAMDGVEMRLSRPTAHRLRPLR